MNQILGFLTAFFVVGWAVRWYFRLAAPVSRLEWHAPKEDTAGATVTRWETFDDMAVIEPFDEPRSKAVAAIDSKSSLDTGDVEKRLEALVESADPSFEVPETDIVSAPSPVMGDNDGNSTADVITENVVGFCARCRDKREVLNPVRTQTKKGKAAIRGTCNVCGAGMFVFISEEKSP